MERPILFNTEMVQAILEGRKTSTRRIAKFESDKTPQEGYYAGRCTLGAGVFNYGGIRVSKIAPYKIGDILYVRETWCNVEEDFNPDDDIDTEDCKYIFKVDDNGEKQPLIESQVKRWRPSIHMPKVAARIFLKVTDVKAQRLRDITEDEAKAEGCLKSTYDSYTGKFSNSKNDSYRDGLIKTWDSCYKWPKCWEANPWVWIIEFEKVDKNEI